MTSRPPGGVRFARAVERSLERLLRKPVVLSPRDWSTLADWHGRGIPLALVLETLDEVVARKKGSPPRSLTYFARAVEESWRAVQEGRALRSGERTRAATAAEPDPAAPWEATRRSGTVPPDLEALLVEMTAALRRGEPVPRIEEALDRALLEGRIAPETRREARRAALAALAGYRDRMTPAAWSRTLDRATAERMRAALGLPRLRPPRRVV